VSNPNQALVESPGGSRYLFLILPSNVQDLINEPNRSEVISAWIEAKLPKKQTYVIVLFHIVSLWAKPCKVK